MSARVDPRLLSEMRRGLVSEARAQSLHARLARVVSDAELARLLDAFHVEDTERAARLRALVVQLGGRYGSREPSIFPHVSLAMVLARAGAQRFVLRLCHESAASATRRYHVWAEHLAAIGFNAEAGECGELAAGRARQATALEAWFPR